MESIHFMINANLALIFVNITCIVIFLTTKYYKNVKYYDMSIKALEADQGEWYVNKILEEELLRIGKAYHKNTKRGVYLSDDSDDSYDSDDSHNVAKKAKIKRRRYENNGAILQPVKLDLSMFTARAHC